MKKIASSGVVYFNNAYHVNYHAYVMGLISQYEATNLGIQETLVEKYQTDIAKLQDAVNRSQAAAETAKLRKADEERDNYYRYVRNVLSNLQFSHDAEMRELYEVAKSKILNIYGADVVSESDNEESAHIRGFIMDVRQYFRTSITKLGLADALAALEKANDDLQEQYLIRVGNQAYYGTELTKKLRAEVDEDYFRIVAQVEYNGQQLEAVDDKTVGLRDNCQSFIDATNQLIVRVKQSIAAGKALSKGKDTEGSEGSEGSNGDNNQQPTTNDQTGNTQQPTTGNQTEPDKDTSKPTNQPGNTNPGVNYGGDLDEVPSEV